MKYLNQFHKESEERKIRKIKEWQSSPRDLQMVLNQQRERERLALNIDKETNSSGKTMDYLNDFHKESAERKMKKVENWQKNPVPASEACKQQFEMHERIAKDYPRDNRR